MSITIVLADDHALVRLGVKARFEAEPDFEIVGEAVDGLEVLPLVERLRPNVLVLDLIMPGVNGLDVTREVTRQWPETKVVILSMHATEGYVLDSLRNGASAYVLKGADTTDLVRAVREVAAGRRFLSPPLSERAVEVYARSADRATLDLYDTLTTREREVFHLAADGYSNADIASRLFVSPRTVETHRANLMRKLGLRSQTELVRYALRRGIVRLEE